MLLSWFWFVEFEAEGVEEGRDLVRGMQVLKGAVMSAGIEATGVGRAITKVGHGRVHSGAIPVHSRSLGR